MSAERSRSLQRLAAVARRQRGLFTLRQALVCGLSKSYIYRQRRARHWLEVEHHVFRYSASERLTWQQRTLALVLATGGIAGGRSAAALFGLMEAPRTAEVVVERRLKSNRHRRPGVRCLDVSLADYTTRVDGIPAATPALTLVLLGSELPSAAIRDVVDNTIVRRLISPRRLAEQTTEMWAPRRHGCAAVLDALRSAHPELWRTRNDWEARVLRLLAEAEAPEPRPNFEVRVGCQRRLLDFAWPETMVALEFDGFVPHSTRRVFDDDRERQNLLVDAGWRIFRITATMLRRRPLQAIAPLLRALASERVLDGSPVNPPAPV